MSCEKCFERFKKRASRINNGAYSCPVCEQKSKKKTQRRKPV